MNAKIPDDDCLKHLGLYARWVDVNGLSRSEVKRTRNRRATAVYSDEEELSIVKSIISSCRKGSDLNDAPGKLGSYTKIDGKEIIPNNQILLIDKACQPQEGGENRGSCVSVRSPTSHGRAVRESS